MKIEHKIKMANNYNSIFNNLADDAFSERHTQGNGAKFNRPHGTVVED